MLNVFLVYNSRVYRIKFEIYHNMNKKYTIKKQCKTPAYNDTHKSLIIPRKFVLKSI